MIFATRMHVVQAGVRETQWSVYGLTRHISIVHSISQVRCTMCLDGAASHKPERELLFTAYI